MAASSPLDPFLERRGMLLLDGGLATELEARGFDLGTPLWSARLLDSDPAAIREVHLAYLEAGADCVVSASYQASVPGFVAVGLSERRARSLIARSVELAREACDEVFERDGQAGSGRLRPLVAASVGPYGAYLADGSEYRGDYGLPKSALRAFHESRWEVLAGTPADLLACETIPSFEEAEVLADLLRQTPEVLAWVSFSCRDGERLRDGAPVRQAAALFAGCGGAVAVGVNCTAPRHVPSLIAQVRRGAPGKAIVVYPNSGELWDTRKRAWSGSSDSWDPGEAACDWYRAGARLIGGCCRVGPARIREMRAALVRQGLVRLQ